MTEKEALSVTARMRLYRLGRPVDRVVEVNVVDRDPERAQVVVRYLATDGSTRTDVMNGHDFMNEHALVLELAGTTSRADDPFAELREGGRR